MFGSFIKNSRGVDILRPQRKNSPEMAEDGALGLAYRIHRKFAPFFAQIFAKKIVKCKNLHKKLRKHLRHDYFLAFICANICTIFWVSKIFAQIFAQLFAQILRLKIFAQLFAEIFSIKHDLARSCFKFWLKIGDKGNKISKKTGEAQIFLGCKTFLGENFSIKHDLARSCFQLWPKVGDEGDKISREKTGEALAETVFSRNFVTLGADFEGHN